MTLIPPNGTGQAVVSQVKFAIDDMLGREVAVSQSALTPTTSSATIHNVLPVLSISNSIIRTSLLDPCLSLLQVIFSDLRSFVVPSSRQSTPTCSLLCVRSGRLPIFLLLCVFLVCFLDAPSGANGQTKTPKEQQVTMQTEIVGEGSTVILVPGGLTGWLSWKPHAERLSTRNQVVRVQLLNVQFGLENRPLPPEYSVTMESHALSATIDNLHLERQIDLVAWSYGAEIALDYALDHPDRVRSLTLIEPPAFWVLRAIGLLDDDARNVVSSLEGLHGDISELQLESFAKMVGLLQPSQSGRDLPQWNVWLEHRLSLRNSPATIQHSDDTTRLKAFQPPVLLVKGTGSAKFLHQIIDTMARFLPHAEVVELPAGHAPQLVSMDQFLKKLESFQSGIKTKK